MSLRDNLKIKEVRRGYIFTLILLALLIVMSAFCFRGSFWRLIESGRDFGLSMGYYFCELFGIKHNIVPTVITLPSLPLEEPITVPTPDINTGVIPFTPDFFYVKMKIWGQTLLNGETYGRFFGSIFNGVMSFVMTLTLFLPILALIIGLCVFLRKRIANSINNYYGIETKALRLFKKITHVTYVPIKKSILDIIDCVRNSKILKLSLILIWLYNFNIITICLEVLAYAFYFVSSFDVLSLYIQLYKLFMDLSLFLMLTPLWVIFLFPLFGKWRRRIASRILMHNEMKNRGFINARSMAVMVLGTMGAGKTSMITDMALSQSAIFRDKCLDTLIRLDLTFPYFKWAVLEQDIRQAMVDHTIFNLPTCRKFIQDRKYKFFDNPTSDNIYDYDYNRYDIMADNGLKIMDIWDVAEIYTQIYFTYVMDTSYIVSNYAIRDDSLMIDRGNLPIWDCNFFRDIDTQLFCSRCSHILDFDVLRFGKKVDKNNKFADTFAFCAVWVMSEGGKERGNQNDVKGVDRYAEEANRLNDLFNTALKLIRHPSTIDNESYSRVIMDEQRADSWGADGRELAELVTILSKDKVRLALPCFWLEEVIFAILEPKFNSKYTDFRHRRGDMTLPMYIYKGICSKFLNYYRKIYNRYGYSTLHLRVERGTRDGEYLEHDYYLAYAKTFANRYSTDVYRDYFDKRAEGVEYGLIDYPEYKGVRVSDEEFSAQHSYFYDELKRLNGAEKNVRNDKKHNSS